MRARVQEKVKERSSAVTNMAHHVVRNIAYLELMESSDEEDFLLIPPPLELIPDEDDDGNI